MSQAPHQPSNEFATLTTDDLVTGEAVALDLPPASLGVRMASGLIDVLVTIILFVVVAIVLLMAVAETDAALVQAAVIGTLILVFVAFPTTLESLTRAVRSKLALACAPCATAPARSPSSTH